MVLSYHIFVIRARQGTPEPGKDIFSSTEHLSVSRRTLQPIHLMPKCTHDKYNVTKFQTEYSCMVGKDNLYGCPGVDNEIFWHLKHQIFLPNFERLYINSDLFCTPTYHTSISSNLKLRRTFESASSKWNLEAKRVNFLHILLAPTGALVVMMGYYIYIYIQPLFQIFILPIDAIDITRVTLSRLNSLNAIVVTGVIQFTYFSPIHKIHQIHPFHPIHLNSTINLIPTIHPIHPIHPIHLIHPIHKIHPVHPMHPMWHQIVTPESKTREWNQRVTP